MKINKLSEDIIYIQDAIPLVSKFVDFIEKNDINPAVNSVISCWEKWVDGYPVKKEKDGQVYWEQHLPETEDAYRGTAKIVNWDLFLDKRGHWPPQKINKDFSSSHEIVYPIIDLIEKSLIESVNYWCEKTGKAFPDYITRNYTIRKYRIGSHGMGPHVDRNIENTNNTMDWTCLIYLNDEYDGGELYFDDLGIKIKPTAGSIIFFPCLTKHSVKPIVDGNKYYIFLFIDTTYNILYALGEQVDDIKEACFNQKNLITSSK